MRPILIPALLAAVIAAPAAAQTAPTTLAAVRARGELLCGTNPGLPGFAQADAAGVVRGLDADTCRAVAAAVFGDAARARFVPVGVAEGLQALRAGRVDLLARNLTQTLSRETGFSLSAAGINFYDGQGFLVPGSAGIADAKGLDGKRVCVGAGTSSELALADAARRLDVTFVVVPVDGFAGLRDAYAAGACEAASADASQLVALRQTGTADPAAHEMLPDIISREPLGPLVRNDDAQWHDIVVWSVNVLAEAEALGVNSANAAARRADPSPRLRQFLGASPGFGAGLGLADDWAFRIVSQVGNYAEVFERNLGENSPLKLERGLNALWSRGGLLYPIPMR
jgi:general L-amino acid transport system substrate-binding protein